jgi:hypothetical protein
MNTLKLSPITDGEGTPLLTRASVYLVDSERQHRIGWVVATGEPITEYRAVSVKEDVELLLVPNALIGIDAQGSPTWYLVTMSTWYKSEIYLIQMPEADGDYDLPELVGLQGVQPGTPMWDTLIALITSADISHIPAGALVPTTVAATLNELTSRIEVLE